MRLFIYNNRPVYHIQIHIYLVGVIRVNKQRVVQMDAPKDRNTLKNQKTVVWKNIFCDNSETKKITPADFWYFFPYGMRIQKMYRWPTWRWGKIHNWGPFVFQICAQSDKQNFPKKNFWAYQLLVHLKRWVFTKFDKIITLGSWDIPLWSLLKIGPFPPGKTSNGCHGRVWRVMKFLIPPNVIPWWVLLKLVIKKISVSKFVERICK